MENPGHVLGQRLKKTFSEEAFFLMPTELTQANQDLGRRFGYLARNSCLGAKLARKGELAGSFDATPATNKRRGSHGSLL